MTVEAKPQLPSWTEGNVCEDCGLPLVWNMHVASGTGDGWRYSHGLRCPESSERLLEHLRLDASLLRVALIDVVERLGAHIFQTDDEEYADVELLQAALMEAWAKGSESIKGIWGYQVPSAQDNERNA